MLTVRDGYALMDGIRLDELAEEHGTPLYVTSQQTLIYAIRSAQQALAGVHSSLVCYAVKANPTLAILQIFARQGLGADVTSGGELFRALKAGIPAEKIVFSGVGKTAPNCVRRSQPEFLQFRSKRKKR